MSDAPLVQTRQVGDIRIHALAAGLLRLDGGAMFGVVPKPLWERQIPADERNRIALAMRCLLVETRDALLLIDTGAGNKESAKFIDIFGLDNLPADSARYATRLEEALAAVGHGIDDIDIVVDTHLHFDHAGGNTRRNPDGAIELAFPRARYVVQRGEYEWAHIRNERIQASYLPHNFEPVMQAGRFDLVDGDNEIVPGVRLLKTPGHTPHHQSVIVRSGGETACYLADLVPTSAHLPLPWTMGYDVEPLVTLETKRRLLQQAREEQWLLVFEHDPLVAWGRLSARDERPLLIPPDTLP
jgi:glyoxylase-like metal-dependent hydrolase (beta-lactamase superfamily II)